MALDQVEVMKHFGFESFALCGHDRGGRVGYRMAFDHSEVVTKLAVLDIVPTWEAFSRADTSFGLSYWHWFFLAQPCGDPFMIPPGVIHNARNIGTVTTKMLSTYVVNKAQPLATLFDE